MPYQSLLWSLLDILLGSLLHSLLGSVLDDSMTEYCLRAAPEKCVHREELSLPYDAFSRWKCRSLWKVWHECGRTESTCLSASGTIITITNAIIIAIIIMTIISLPASPSPLDWMCPHTPTICWLLAADFARKSESQNSIFYFFRRI